MCVFLILTVELRMRLVRKFRYSYITYSIYINNVQYFQNKKPICRWFIIFKMTETNKIILSIHIFKRKQNKKIIISIVKSLYSNNDQEEVSSPRTSLKAVYLFSTKSPSAHRKQLVFTNNRSY